MSEPIIIAAYVFAGAFITGLFGLIGAGFAIIVPAINARSTAKQADRAGVIASDAAAFARITEVQVIQQGQLNRQDVTNRELQKALSDATAEILVLNRKLEEAEKAPDYLKQELEDLRKQLAELQDTLNTMQGTIDGLQATLDTMQDNNKELQKTIDGQQKTIEELRAREARMPESSTGEK